MKNNYPAVFETGDIVFTCIGASLFREVSTASRCWYNHVGSITGYPPLNYRCGVLIQSMTKIFEGSYLR